LGKKVFVKNTFRIYRIVTWVALLLLKHLDEKGHLAVWKEKPALQLTEAFLHQFRTPAL
jgi:hypothetical protein